MRGAPLLAGLALLAACDRRSILLPDAGGLAGDRSLQLRDVERPLERDRSAPACRKLALRVQTPLGLTNAATVQARHPDLAFDGSGRFGVVWTSQSPGSAPASLAFASVQLDGSAKIPGGVPVGATKPEVEPELIRAGPGFEVLYAGPQTMSLSRLDGEGAVLATLAGPGAPQQFALAPHSLGTAVLYVNPLVTELRFALFSATGLAKERLVHTGEPYWSLWLDRRQDGFAAYWGKRAARLDAEGSLLDGPATVLAADGLSQAHAALPDGGHAIAYARGSDFAVELQRLDAAGKPVGGPSPVGQANIGAAPFRQLGLAVLPGGELVVSFAGIKPGEGVKAQLLAVDGAKLGDAVLLPPCLVTSSATGAAAAGGGRVAIASVDGYSGLSSTAICVSLLECQ